jgi:NADPH:quinone reductase-like Zn-dependent oxidoreductase
MGGYHSMMGTPMWLMYGRQAFGKAGFLSASKLFVAEDLHVSLAGKHVIVTGANSGLGYQTTKALVQLGAHVAMVCRNRERGEAALARACDETGCPAELLSLFVVDMEDSESVRARGGWLV